MRSAVVPAVRFGAGLVDAGCLDAVPAVRSSRQARIPSVWGPGEVARIVEAIDRDNPCGKRDYAIILLVARLGLRGADVSRLEFADFDWPGNQLLVTQAKTGDPVQLPLLKDVGWAVIDYVRHGRPASDCPQVFLRHHAPVGPFSDQDHLHQMLVKPARATHVPVSDKRRHGMHSLRHSLATRLMEDGTPWSRSPTSSATCRSIDRRLPEILPRPAGQVRAGSGRAGNTAGVTVTGASRWPGRSPRSSLRNAPSAISTTPRSGCWTGSRRLRS